MSDPFPFKSRHFQADIILCAVRWYLRYALSYRDVEELMRERSVWVDHTTVYRWVQRYAPELDKRCRPYLRATSDSYRMDETYIRIKKQWSDLFRAIDSMGATLDFMLSPTRDADAAERFFRQVLQASHTRTPRVITVDKNAVYPMAFEAPQHAGILPETCLPRPCKYLDNVMEQDHRFVKRRVNPSLGFGAFNNQLFGRAASRAFSNRSSRFYELLQHNLHGRGKVGRKGTIAICDLLALRKHDARRTHLCCACL